MVRKIDIILGVIDDFDILVARIRLHEFLKGVILQIGWRTGYKLNRLFVNFWENKKIKNLKNEGRNRDGNLNWDDLPLQMTGELDFDGGMKKCRIGVNSYSFPGVVLAFEVEAMMPAEVEGRHAAALSATKFNNYKLLY